VRAAAAGEGIDVSRFADLALVARIDACTTLCEEPGSDGQTLAKRLAFHGADDAADEPSRQRLPSSPVFPTNASSPT